MMQRITDFITAQSIRAKSLSLSTRLFRIVVLLVILAIPTLLCGFLVSFKVVFQMWLLVLAAIVPLVGGFFLIGKHKWKNHRVALLLVAGLIGFVAFEWSLVGMLIDERSRDFSLMYVLSNAAFIGFAFFIVSVIGYILFNLVPRVSNRKGKDRLSE